MRRIRVAGPARRDIANALRRSEVDFGIAARTRYRRLIDKAIQDLGRDPGRIGVRSLNDVRPGYFIYHLQFSRRAVQRDAVVKPRHAIVFRLDDQGDVIIARLLHERQLLTRHLDSSER